MSNSNFSAEEVLQAVHVLTAVGSDRTSSTPATSPSLEYGAHAPAVAMTPDNSRPGLAAWLFLVTNPDFLNALDSGTFGSGNQTTSLMSDIAAKTTLTEKCVNEIFDTYRKPSAAVALPPGVTDLKAAFRAVTNAFQAYASSSLYPRGQHCPGDGSEILCLAKYGTAQCLG